MTPEEKKQVWDPFGQRYIPVDTKQVSKLNKKLEKYNNDPKIPQRNLLLLSIPGIICLGLFIVAPNFLPNLFHLPPDTSIFIVFLGFVPVFIYYVYIYNLQRDLIKLLIAQKKQWLYNPTKSFSRWVVATKSFPEFFNKGNHNQNLQDEFWGKHQNINFYTSIFQYTIRTHHKNGTSHRTFYKTVFAIQLPKILQSTFQLISANRSILERIFSKQNLQTESLEFNKLFRVVYNGKEGITATNIIKTLSPALMEKLIKLKKQEKNPEIYFKKDVVLFLFDGRLLPKMKTNFFRTVELDPRDQEFIENRINKILKISQEMIKYLD